MNNVVFHRDETSLHNVPAFVPGLMMLDVFVCVGSGICIVSGLFTQNQTMALTAVIVLLIGLLASSFCDNFFNWYVNCQYDLSNKNQLIYSYNLNGVSVSNSKTVIVVKHVDSFKVKGKTILIKGEIEKKVPLRPTKTVSKITIQFDFDEDCKKAVLERLEKL